MVASIGYLHSSNNLVLTHIITRPCAEGLGLYKILIFQLCLMTIRERFNSMIVRNALKDNAMILGRWGFKPILDWKYITYKDYFLTYEEIQRDVFNFTTKSYGAKWDMSRWFEEVSLSRGIKLKGMPPFPYANQLNNQLYVDTKHDNRDAVLDKPEMGFPNSEKRRILERIFRDREDSFEVVRKEGLYDAAIFSDMDPDDENEDDRETAAEIAAQRPYSAFVGDYVKSGVADEEDFPGGMPEIDDSDYSHESDSEKAQDNSGRLLLRIYQRKYNDTLNALKNIGDKTPIAILAKHLQITYRELKPGGIIKPMFLIQLQWKGHDPEFDTYKYPQEEIEKRFPTVLPKLLENFDKMAQFPVAYRIRVLRNLPYGDDDIIERIEKFIASTPTRDRKIWRRHEKLYRQIDSIRTKTPEALIKFRFVSNYARASENSKQKPTELFRVQWLGEPMESDKTFYPLEYLQKVFPNIMPSLVEEYHKTHQRYKNRGYDPYKEYLEKRRLDLDAASQTEEFSKSKRQRSIPPWRFQGVRIDPDTGRLVLSGDISEVRLSHEPSSKEKSMSSSEEFSKPEKQRPISPLRIKGIKLDPDTGRPMLSGDISKVRLLHEPSSKNKSISPTESDEPGDVSDSDEEEYEVEAIVGKNEVKVGKKNIIEYRVKWKGYDASENSWVTKDELMRGCSELVKEFEARISTAKGT